MNRAENRFLAEPAGGERHAGDGDPGARESDEGDGDVFAQAAHVAHVLLMVHRVDHRARAEEQQGLEEGVRDNVPHGGAECAGAGGEKHVAELRNGGVSENFLDIPLRHADRRGQHGGDETHHGDDVHGDGRLHEDRGRAAHHVDAGGDHGGGVDERRDGRGAFHRVRQPDVKGNLRAFARGAHHQQQADGGDPARGVLHVNLGGLREDVLEG